MKIKIDKRMKFGISHLARMRSSPILLLTGQQLFCYGPVALLPRGNGVNTAFCGPARDTLLSNRNTEKLNFDTNYITKTFGSIRYIYKKILNTFKKNGLYIEA